MPNEARKHFFDHPGDRDAQVAGGTKSGSLRLVRSAFDRRRVETVKTMIKHRGTRMNETIKQ